MISNDCQIDVFRKKITQGSRRPNKSLFIQKRSPVSLIEILTPTNESDKSDIDVIFTAEDQNFYERYKDIHSLSPLKSPEIQNIHRLTSKSQPKRNLFTNKPRTLPFIKGNKELKQNLFTKRNLVQKLDTFVASTNDIQQKLMEDSSKVSFFIDKERNLAKNYLQNIKRTSDKIIEMSDFIGKLPNSIFREQQSNLEEDLQEQKKIIKKYNVRNLDYYKRRVKGIKKFLLDFKNKVIP